MKRKHRNNPKYWDRQAWTNSVDPDQTPQNAASDQGLHCLPLVQQQNSLNTSVGSHWLVGQTFFQILEVW